MFPLYAQEEELGACLLFCPKPSLLTENNIALLSVLADQINMAVVNAKQYNQIKQLAITDKLTGLYNRRHFMDMLDKEITRSKQFFKPISIVLTDIDYFGKYNDMHGHPQGDAILKELATVLKGYARSVDDLRALGRPIHNTVVCWIRRKLLQPSSIYVRYENLAVPDKCESIPVPGPDRWCLYHG